MATTPCDDLSAELGTLDAATDGMEDVWHERPAALARLVDRAEAADCTDLARHLRWEAMLAFAYTSNAALLETDRPRFTEVHPELLEDDALDYLVARTSVVSAYVRSRVADFLWEHGGASRRRHAVRAGAAYLDVASTEVGKVSLNNFGWLRVGDTLVRTAELAKAANQRTTIRAVADKALELLQRLSAEGTLRHVLDMALALVEVADVLDAAEGQIVDAALSSTADAFTAVGDYHLARAAMTVRRRFAAACKQPDEVLRAIDVEIARSCLQEGEQREREGAHLIASVAFNQALEQFEKIGSEKALTELARAAVRRTRAAGIGEMGRITSGPIQLSPEHQAHIERVIETVSSAAAPDCFRLIALHPALLVTRAEAEESEKMRRQVAPLTDMLPRVILRDPGQTLAPHDPGEASRLRLFQTALQLLRVQDGLILNTLLERLIARDDLGPDTLMQHLRESGHIPEHCLPIIGVGVHRAWERDWVSALHILLPQLEEVMRSMVRRAGRDSMRTHKAIPGVTVEMPLAWILDQLANIIVDDGVVFMLNLVLDLYGLNLRNQFGHGLVDIVDCDIENVARVLQLYCILCALHPGPDAGPVDEGSDRPAAVG